ncbi:MAG: DUF805 domain-containing protein [Firmicutes bacterium]|nr:DUF805 domain-containing protein [Bacillota bacterium]
MQWYLTVLKRYAVFSGRANRAEFWGYTAVNFIFSLIAAVLNRPTHGVLESLYALFVFIPSLAVQVRRLHDTNRSAWWLLLVLIPVIGSIILLILDLLPGTPEINRFGPPPPGKPLA